MLKAKTRKLLTPGQILLSLAMVDEVEWFQQTPVQSAVRAALRGTGAWPVTDSLDLGFDAFYTPAVLDPGDFRLYGELFATVKLVPDLLALKLSLADEFDSRPQAGIKPNDVGVFTTLQFTLGQ